MTEACAAILCAGIADGSRGTCLFPGLRVARFSAGRTGAFDMIGDGCREALVSGVDVSLIMARGGCINLIGASAFTTYGVGRIILLIGAEKDDHKIDPCVEGRFLRAAGNLVFLVQRHWIGGRVRGAIAATAAIAAMRLGVKTDNIHHRLCRTDRYSDG